MASDGPISTAWAGRRDGERVWGEVGAGARGGEAWRPGVRGLKVGMCVCAEHLEEAGEGRLQPLDPALVAHPAQLAIGAGELRLLGGLENLDDVLVRAGCVLGAGELHLLLHRTDLRGGRRGVGRQEGWVGGRAR